MEEGRIRFAISNVFRMQVTTYKDHEGFHAYVYIYIVDVLYSRP